MHEPNWLMGYGLVGIAALWYFSLAFIMFECACIQITIMGYRARMATNHGEG